MKRSEMVRRIKEYLGNATSTNTQDLERVAHQLLTIIEDAGMEPPEVALIINPNNHEDHQLDTYRELVNKWESEDV